jgi:hypothetical protein
MTREVQKLKCKNQNYGTPAADCFDRPFDKLRVTEGKRMSNIEQGISNDEVTKDENPVFSSQ